MVGLSFGTAAEAYDRGRREWPEDLLDEVPVPGHATVVDLGAGTGKLTRLLVSRFRRVVAVEPDPAMRDHLLPEGLMPDSSSPKHGSFMSGEWRCAFDSSPFEPFRAHELPQERDVSREQLLQYFSSVSLVTALPSEERAETLARIGAALPRPRYRQRWTSCLYWTRLRS